MITIKELPNAKIQLINSLDTTNRMIKLYQNTQPNQNEKMMTFIGSYPASEVIIEKEDDFPIYYIWEGEQTHITSYRKLPLEGTFNFRDLGGYSGADGLAVKWGKLFRADALSSLTVQDIEIIEEIGVKTIIDFRGDGEWQKAPDVSIPHAKIINLSPNAKVAQLASGSLQDDQKKIQALLDIANGPNGTDYFEKRLNEMAQQMVELVEGAFPIEQYRKFMYCLLDEKSAPVVFHCRGGKDRTGMAAILILSALGVSKEDITTDYHLTKACMKNRNEIRMNEYRQYTDNKSVLAYLSGLMDTREAYLDAAYQTIEKMAGNFEGYLKQIIGLTAEDITKLQTLYLE